MAKDERWRATERAGHDRRIVFGAFVLALSALAIALFNRFSVPAQLTPNDLRVLTQAAVADRQETLGKTIAAAVGSPDLVRETLEHADPGKKRAFLRNWVAAHDQLDGIAIVAGNDLIVAPRNDANASPVPGDAVIKAQAEAARQFASEWEQVRETQPTEKRAAFLHLAEQKSALVADKGHVLLVSALPYEPGPAASPSPVPSVGLMSREPGQPAAGAATGGNPIAVGWDVVAGPSASDTLRFVPGRQETVSGVPVRDEAGLLAGHLIRRSEAAPNDFGRAISLIIPGILALACAFALFGRKPPRKLPQPETHLAGELPEGATMADVAAPALQRLHETHGNLAMLRIRIDNFEDLCRHRDAAFTDNLVSLLQSRMRIAIRTGDVLHYEGNGLFSLLQVHLETLADARNVARRLVAAVGAPLMLGGRDVAVSLSVGVAVAPENGRTLPLLIHHADLALEKTGTDERFSYAFYDRRTDEEAKLRDIVEEDLAAAIGTDQITLHYQPIYSSDGERIVGVESLVRWFHPELGFIPPTRFIPIAEERGLVSKLGLWALRQACEDGRRWPTLTVAVNVSPVQFRTPNFVQEVLDIVEATGFDPWRLELELTEGVVVVDPELAEMQMMELRASGIRIALDDFGTGYSSLIYLRRFAIDKIKIDRSFLESMETTGESAILVHSVVHLGRALGLTVTAEGVETPDQHRFLQAAGCHQLQGFLFSHPVEAREIDRLVAAKGAKGEARFVA